MRCTVGSPKNSIKLFYAITSSSLRVVIALNMATETLPECQNLAEPLYLPIENTAVTDTSSTAKSWGITLGLGTPGQNVVLRPSLWQKTLVSRNDDCQGATDYDCLAKVGGTFDPQLSSTCVNLTASSGWNSTLSNQDTASEFDLYQDTLSFGGTTAKGWGFPFSTWSEPGWSMFALLPSPPPEYSQSLTPGS